jgi:hypothetical protein
MAEKEDMTEQQYLELANQLKESFDKKDKEVETLLKENESIKKDFIKSIWYVKSIKLLC